MTAGVRRTVGLALGAILLTAPASTQERHDAAIQLGPRPFFLVDRMADGELKDRLSPPAGDVEPKLFSIGHRGAPLQFPEHTRKS